MTVRVNAPAVNSKQPIRVNALPLKNKRSVRVNSGDNFGAPARDNTESFKGSTAGNSNWNSYEGGDDKKLTKEEKKALNEKAEAESKARRAAAAIKLQAEKDAWMKEQAQ